MSMNWNTKNSHKQKNSRENFFWIKLVGISLVAFLLFVVGNILIGKTRGKKEEISNNEEEIHHQEEEEQKKEYKRLEIFEKIDGEMVYIATEDGLNEKDYPRPVVVYNHGSTFVVNDKEDNPLLADLRLYADIFAKNGYIFAASNAHGDNWGNAQSIKDNKSLVDYINSKYHGSKDIYLLGFSMGGLPTMNFAEKYPENVKKIALLAPTTYASTWKKNRVERIKDIDIKIWHGDKDVNVPYSMTRDFVAMLQKEGKDVEVVTVEGKTHFDVDTEYIEDVLEFFKK